MNDQQLPWSPEAEVEVLGCPLIDPATLDTLRDMLTPEQFYQPAHQQLFRAFVKVYTETGTVDYPLMIDQLKRQNAGIQWHNVLSAVMDRAGTTSNVEHYAKRVAETARLRAVIEAASAIRYEATQQPEDVDAFCATVQEQLRRAAEGGLVSTSVSSASALDAFEGFCQAKAEDAPAELRGLLTGWTSFDELTDGLPRKMVVDMGRPGMGKSALALSWAFDLGVAGWKVGIWSGEMDEPEVWGRGISRFSYVPYLALTSRYALSNDQAREGAAAAHRIADSSFELDCQPGLTAEQLVVRAHRMRRKLGGLDLFVVDHFHLMRHPRANRGERLDEAMARSSGLLRDLAKELACCVLVCAQLSRECERRPDKRPILSDLRECGALEQDAQLVISPYRPYVYDQAYSKTAAELLIRKNRNGPTAPAAVEFIPSTIGFRGVV